MYRRTTLLAGLLLAAHATFAQASPIRTVSPGGLQNPTRIADGCPTFSWGEAAGANSYEVAVFDALDDDNGDYQTHAEINQPILETSTAAPALSWTPASEQCLDQGGHYLWFVRATTADGMGNWSQGRRFEVELGSGVLAETVREEVAHQLSQSDTWQRVIQEALKVGSGGVLPLMRSLDAHVDKPVNAIARNEPVSTQGSGNTSGKNIATRAASFPNPAAFRISSPNGVVFDDPTFDNSVFPAGGSGGVPAEGEGARMMWYPAKAAFRAGYVSGYHWDADTQITGTLTAVTGSKNINGIGTAFLSELHTGDTIEFRGTVFGGWGVIDIIENDSKLTLLEAWSVGGYEGPATIVHIGLGSVAMGVNTVASGYHSTAMGLGAIANGFGGATAMGFHAKAGGLYGATAMGRSTKASGSYGSTAMGNATLASGSHGAIAMGSGAVASGSNGAIALGFGTTAASDSETVVGRYNTDITGGVFTVGNGTDFVRSNAMVVLKNGNTGIGTSSPKVRLHVDGGTDCSPGGADGAVVTRNISSENICIDGNEIMARNNGTTSKLYLNADGGDTEIGGKLLVKDYASATGIHLCVDLFGTLATCSSSERYKESIEPLPMGIGVVENLKPVTFKWKGREEYSLGFVAEQVAAINPLLVTYDRDGRIQGVKYPQMTAVLTNAIQEQQQQIESLKSIVCIDHPEAEICL